MTSHFSVDLNLKPSPWARTNIEEPPADWPIILDYLRRLWEIEEETVLETEFYKRFELGLLEF